MSCPNCETEWVAFAVPAAFRELLPENPPGAALCPRCLTLEPRREPPTGDPDFARVAPSFPTGDAAVPMALVVGLSASLATNRSAIATLLERVERAGTDPLLVFDRLASAEGVDSEIDLRGRRRQLEQLL